MGRRGGGDFARRQSESAGANVQGARDGQETQREEGARKRVDPRRIHVERVRQVRKTTQASGILLPTLLLSLRLITSWTSTWAVSATQSQATGRWGATA
eukprot:768814-Hanusia_phi.AAC.7